MKSPNKSPRTTWFQQSILPKHAITWLVDHLTRLTWLQLFSSYLARWGGSQARPTLCAPPSSSWSLVSIIIILLHGQHHYHPHNFDNLAMCGNVDQVYLVVHPNESTTVFAKEATASGEG